jgi:hypothetical protein
VALAGTARLRQPIEGHSVHPASLHGPTDPHTMMRDGGRSKAVLLTPSLDEVDPYGSASVSVSLRPHG